MVSAPQLLSGPAAQAASAWRHAAAALGLLRRRPSLLLLPLVVAVFGVAERQTGAYLTLRYTAWGRLLADGRYTRSPVTWGVLPLMARVRETVQQFSHPIPPITLRGATHLAWSVAAGPEAQSPASDSNPWHHAAAVAAGALVAALSAFVLAGYYGVAGAAAESGQARWRSFGHSVRRFWLRFWLFELVLAALSVWVISLYFLTPSPAADHIAAWWTAWVVPLVSFLLVLSPFAFIVGDVRLGEAMKRSVAAIWRGLPTAILLLLGFGLLRALLLVPLSEAAEAFFARPSPTDFAARTLLDVPWLLVLEGWDALAGVWLCLAMFFWYREAARTAAPAPSRPTPAC